MKVILWCKTCQVYHEIILPDVPCPSCGTHLHPVLERRVVCLNCGNEFVARVPPQLRKHDGLPGVYPMHRQLVSISGDRPLQKCPHCGHVVTMAEGFQPVCELRRVECLICGHVHAATVRKYRRIPGRTRSVIVYCPSCARATRHKVLTVDVF